MASNWPPVKNAAFTMGFFVYKNDGTIIANPTLAGSNVHVDLGTTEVTNSTLAVVDSTTGLCSIALAQATMNGDQIDGTVTSSSTGAVVYTFKIMTAAQTLDTTDAAVDAAVTDIGAVHTHINDIHDTDLPAVKTDTGGIKTMTDKIGTVTNTGGTASIGAILGDFANSALVTRVADIHTDVADVHTDVAAVKAETALIVLDTGTDIPATLAGFATTADVADAVLDEALSGHTTAGTAGKGITDAAASVGTGTGLTAIPWNAAWDAEVQSECQDAITASGIPAATVTALGTGSGLTALSTQVSVNDLPTNAELATALGTADDAVLAAVAALADDADVAAAVWAHADGVLVKAAVHTDAAGTNIAADIIAAKADTAATKVVADLVAGMYETDGAVKRWTANALEQAPSGTGSTPQQVWEYATRALTDKAGFTLHADYNAAKTAATQTSVNDLPTNAELATALGTADDAVLAAVAALDAVVDTVKAETVLILEDTGTTIPGTITTMQGNVTTIMADTDLLDDAVGGIADIHTDVAAVKSETAAIKAKTDNLPASPAAVGSNMGTVSSVTGAVGSVTGAVGSVTGAVGSVTAGVTVTTNNDKTGYTASTVSDKTGYALTAAYDSAKTAATQTSVDTMDGIVDNILSDTALLEKWALDKFVGTDNGDGTVTYVLYDSDSTTPLKTWVETTASHTRAKAT